MKISIISDTHLGFGSGTERYEDAFEAFQEALEKSLDSDLIILPGDIFDSKVPTPETFSRAMELLVKPKLKGNQVKILEGTKKLEGLSRMNLTGIPVVAIHGTHERRTREMVNPMQALEKAGFLLHLHCSSLIFEKSGERVCIQGIGGVPEQYAESAIREWDPKPAEGCRNILILHQTISGFVPAPQTLPREALPKGFDIIINGHLHEPKIDGNLLLAGSTIQTQLGKESVNPRGFWTLDTAMMGLTFHKLESQRPVHYLKPASREELEPELDKILSSNPSKKPLVRISLKGEDYSKEIQARFGDRMIISFKKNSGKEEFSAKTIEEQRLSVQELGSRLLSQNLSEQGLEPRIFEQVFELLQEKRPEEALETLRESLNLPGTIIKHGQENSQEAGEEADKEA